MMNNMNREAAAIVRRAVPVNLANPRMDELAESVRAANFPERFRELEPEQQAALVKWIQAVLVPAKTIFRRTSYGMKHDFAEEPDGFYVNNGAFKGAMLAAGFTSLDANELNWCFRVKPFRELDAWEKDKRRMFGRGWLVRDRWRENGYVVALRSQRRRIGEYNRACQREGRTKLLVLRGTQVAEIILDTHPGGYRLTDAAALEIAALFDRLNPSGRNRSITNNCLAVIRRVPVLRAENVAEALLTIARGCLVGASGDSGVSMIPTGEEPPRASAEVGARWEAGRGRHRPKC